MIKFIGQKSLNKIGQKYKELKTLVNKKADKTEIKTKLSELTGDSTHRTVTDTEKSNWDNKVDKISGKGLSANDYTDSDKAKVDAIPANPKYTDTTYDLSKYAEKSNISRCKTKGYNTSNTWQSLSTERDLEDWIGDFDKRTRELQNNKGLTGDSSEISQQVFSPNSGGSFTVNATKWGRIIQLSFMYDFDADRTTYRRWRFALPEKFTPSGTLSGSATEGWFRITPNSGHTSAELEISTFNGMRQAQIAGVITYIAVVK